MTLTIARQEIATLFKTPAAWIILAIVQLLLGLSYLLFTRIYSENVNDIVSWLFKISLYLLLFIVPILSVKTLTMERQNETLIFLLSKPISSWQIIFGKFIGVSVYLTLLLSLALMMALSTVLASSADYAAIIAYWIGTLICIISFTAICFFICSLTTIPILAIGGSLLILLFFMFIELFTNTGIAWLDQILLTFSLFAHLNNFMRGLLTSTDIIFYCTATGLFLFLSHISIKRIYEQG